MKNLIILPVLFICSFSFAQETSKEETKKEGESVEEVIDNGIKALEGLFSNKPKAQRDKDNSTKEGNKTASTKSKASTKSDTAFPSKNDFIGSIDMVFNSYKNDKLEKGSPVNIEMAMKEDATAMKMSSGKDLNSLIVIQLDTDDMIMIPNMADKSQGIKMKKPKIRSANEPEDFDIKKTGNTKVIDGYQCEEYIITSKDGTTNSWVTKDLIGNWEDFSNSMAAFARSGKNPYQDIYGEEFQGFPIHSTTISNNGKSKHIMELKNIKVGTFDASIFDTRDYNIMTMPSFN